MVCRLSASPDEGSTGWKFYFKLYCFLDTDNVPKDSVEFAFMFEQVRLVAHCLGMGLGDFCS